MFKKIRCMVNEFFQTRKKIEYIERKLGLNTNDIEVYLVFVQGNDLLSRASESSRYEYCFYTIDLRRALKNIGSYRSCYMKIKLNYKEYITLFPAGYNFYNSDALRLDCLHNLLKSLKGDNK